MQSEAAESWYLYVVEKLDDDRYQVLPIANPVRAAAKWILCGESWRTVAEEAKEVAGHSHRDPRRKVQEN